MVDLEHLTIETIFGILLVFCRVGSNLMVLPGIGDGYVSIRFRLLIALGLSVIIFPVISNIPVFPKSTSELFTLIIIEIFIGIFIGLITRVLMGAAHIAGLIVASQSGLGSALLFDPTQSTQGAIIGSFFSVITMVLLFVTDLHHMLIEGIADSYEVFKPGMFISTGDHAEQMINLMADSFTIAIKMVTPQLVVSLLLLIASGILARLMPSLQIFFLITPIQLLLSFFIIMITISVSMMWYINFIQEASIGLLSP
jgi:flagellar biosynthetic protein FliR